MTRITEIAITDIELHNLLNTVNDARHAADQAMFQAKQASELASKAYTTLIEISGRFAAAKEAQSQQETN
tara:strand:+ start:562 stop:771 length:210 start_codon:yes stop_codon:yes gene_type:complete